MEPIEPDGVTATSSHWQAIQQAALPASVFAIAAIGLPPRASKMSWPSSAMRSLEPPGESMSSRMAPTFGSAFARLNAAITCSTLVPPLMLEKSVARGMMTP